MIEIRDLAGSIRVMGGNYDLQGRLRREGERQVQDELAAMATFTLAGPTADGLVPFAESARVQADAAEAGLEQARETLQEATKTVAKLEAERGKARAKLDKLPRPPSTPMIRGGVYNPQTGDHTDWPRPAVDRKMLAQRGTLARELEGIEAQLSAAARDVRRATTDLNIAQGQADQRTVEANALASAVQELRSQEQPETPLLDAVMGMR